MAGNAIHLLVEGTKQGKFKGTGKDNIIECAYYGYTLVSPRDIASGMATGKREHHPVMIHKELNQSSPQFAQALVTNESLKKVTLKFFHAKGSGSKGSGKEVHYYTITLTNARVIGIRHFAPDSIDFANAPEPPTEEIQFTFEKIEWNSIEGNTVASDDWSSSKT
jgi:type VI secretion system secreted protein Hcp